MDILFISARYIYAEDALQVGVEKLPIFKNIEFANKLKKFSEKGNLIVFVDVWPTKKRNNKELTEFFGQEKDRGEILFYTDGYAMKKLVDNNFESMEHKKYLTSISLGTNFNDMDLLIDRIVYFYYKQRKNINKIYIKYDNFDTMFEKKIFDILTKIVKENQWKQQANDCQITKKLPVKILFTDKDGTIFGKNIKKEQEINNQISLQKFTDQGNIAVIITSGHGENVFDGFGIGYTNSNLYGVVLSKVASICINNTGKIISDIEYPSLPIATSYKSNKREVVKLFLDYFLEIGYTFDGIYAIGDSENDFGMLEYVKEIGGIANLIGEDITSFSEFIENIKNEPSKTLKYFSKK